MLDAGPNRPSSFHIVGGQFDTVYFEGGFTWKKLLIQLVSDRCKRLLMEVSHEARRAVSVVPMSIKRAIGKEFRMTCVFRDPLV